MYHWVRLCDNLPFYQMKVNRESAFVSVQGFAFKPREKLPAVSEQWNKLLTFSAWLQIKASKNWIWLETLLENNTIHNTINPWRYRECQYGGSMGPSDYPETVDLTAEDGIDLFADLYDEETGK